jgi:hypothetical protein
MIGRMMLLQRKKNNVVRGIVLLRKAFSNIKKPSDGNSFLLLFCLLV